MKLELKLTNRDKILLSICILILVVIGGFFLIIKPSHAAIISLKSDLTIAKDKMQVLKNNLSQEDVIKSTYSEITAKAKVAADDFFDEAASPEVVEQIISDFLKEHYIEYNSINVSTFSQTRIEPYTFQQPSVSYPIKDFANEIQSLPDISSGEADEGYTPLEDTSLSDSGQVAAEVTQATVTIDFISTFNNILAFVDFISNNEQLIRVDSLTVNLVPQVPDVVNGSLVISLKGAARLSK